MSTRIAVGESARTISAFKLAAALVLMFVATAQAQFLYTNIDGQITITGYTGYGGNVVVPTLIDGMPVTSIGAGAFQDNTNLSVVILPDTVTNIGASAFSGCIWLFGVGMPAHLSNIADNTFYNCFLMTGVTIPDGVTNIGSHAFFQCSSLVNIRIPDSVTTIGDHAFDTDWRLTQATLGNGVAAIGDFAFAGCTVLTNVLLGTNVQSIGQGAFNSCSNLASLTFPKSVASIGSQAFANCIGLETVYFMGNAPSNSGDAFFGDTLTFVDYMPHTTGWGTTFGGAPAVLWNPQASPPGLMFGSQQNGFGFNVAGDKSLSVVVEASTNLVNPVWIPIGTNILASGPSVFTDPDWASLGSRFYRFRPAPPSDFIGVVTNGEVMLTQYRGGSGTVKIPDTINGLPVTGVGAFLFNYQYFGITNLVLGSNVTRLEPFAFVNLGNVTNIVLDDALTSITSNSFFGAGMTNVFIPAGVTNIDAGAFLDCYHLTNFTVDVANPAYSTVDGVLFNTSKTSLIAFPNGRAGAYVIPDGVTNIAADAFQYCTRLTSITIPNGVRTIGDNAFYQCASLTSIDLPSGLLTLGNSAFTLSGLKSANIPSGVLGDDAFDGCYSLAHIMLGTNVTSIGSIAFDDCVVPSVFIPQSVTNIGTMPFADSALTNITVDPLNPAYRSVNGVLFDSGQTRLIQYPAARSGNYVIPDSVTNIGDGAFWSCIGLTNVTIPEGVQYLGPEAFDYCISLTNVSLPNGITNIPYAAFEDCFSLTNVSLGTNVIDIGFNAFSSCRSLEGVTLPDSVVQIEPGAFSTCRALKSITLGNQVASIGYDAFADCDDLSKIIIQSSGLHIGSYAFEYGPTNRAFYFTGDAPSLDSSPFYQNVATVYYLAGSVGWGPTLDNLPTALWNP